MKPISQLLALASAATALAAAPAAAPAAPSGWLDGPVACTGGWRDAAPATVHADTDALQLEAEFDDVKPSTACKAIVLYDYEQPEEGGAVKAVASHVVSFTSGPQGIPDPAPARRR
jgi:hypothetical protein